MSFCKRLLASFLAASLALGVFCPVQAYAADRETPAQWAAWIGEALANGFTDFVHSFEPAASIPGVAAWSLTYGTSAAMAQAVRDLPEYKELYGSNPLDHSTVIHAYDGGEMVSVLDVSGLYNAYLWMHEGVPPQPDEEPGGDSTLPVGAPIYIYRTDVLPSSVTFDNGTTYNFNSGLVRAYASMLENSGTAFMMGVGSAPNSVVGLGSSATSPPSGNYGFGIRSRDLSQSFGLDDRASGTWLYWLSEQSGVNYRLSINDLQLDPKPSRSTSISSANSSSFTGPVGWFYTSSQYSSSTSPIYVVCSSDCPIWLYGSWYTGQAGPGPAPEPVPPVGPSSPDIQNPESPDVPESDGPIQYNTTTNITVTLPDGTTTIVEAPTVDTLPIVHWLSIINSNLVAWSRTIYEAMDGWLANISQWLQEIYSEVESFKLSMDAWMVSLLSAIDKLGGDWPMSTENNTDYWNNVTVVNNNIWSGAPDLNAVNVVADDFERLKGKFPVSIPWDLAAILLLFKADPVTPEFSVPLVYFDGSTKTQTLDVDLEPFDGVMSTWRRLVFIAFAGALALKSKDLLENFAEVFNIV